MGSQPTGTSRDKLTVVCIVGAGRSGSTIVDRILGTLEGVSSYNEMHRIWLHGFIQNQRCSCGEEFRGCAFWRSVVDGTFDDYTEAEFRRIIDLQLALHRSRHFFTVASPIRPPGFNRRLAEYRDELRKLYFAIARISGDGVIVDSSKLPTGPLILAGIPGIDVELIHIVRDLRGCVYSWQKKKVDPGSGRLQGQHNALRATAYWAMRNVLAQSLALRFPYTRVRYEDIMMRPRHRLSQLVQEIDSLAGKKLKFLDEQRIALPAIHAMSGNPQRFVVGPTTLSLDDAWKTSLQPSIRRAVTAAAFPLLLYYGYVG